MKHVPLQQKCPSSLIGLFGASFNVMHISSSFAALEKLMTQSEDIDGAELWDANAKYKKKKI